MADKCDLCLLGLIVLSSLLSGSSGVDDGDDHVFISSGGNVRLSCNNALSGCTSTTWLYNRFRHSAAVELIAGGMKKKDTERHESLSLGSDCSLNINNVTIEDRGVYTCQQYVNGHHQGPDASVDLHVLHVSSSSSSSSSSETQLSSGRSVTLSCQLYPGYSCYDWVRSEDIELLWVNQAGVDLQTDSRYQISAPDRCNITLTTTLLNEDHNREWRCEVTQRKQLKTSVTHTVKSSDDVSEHSSSAVDSSTLIPVSSSNSQKKSSSTTSAAPTQENQKSLTTRSSERTTATHTPVYTAQVIVSIVEMAVFAAATVILLQIICARRAGRKDSQRPEEIEMPTI
ncbi:tyrosine-protein phosphatase non-receptor type substrate 1-like [Pseudorasbora parva]|uniref:tyrosine-protein phosphatase non-receptor type substrate 1-like n=1 Tax=Pseudorasbora parva TaxID=51549 RepID=UPI00351F537F